MSGTSTMLAKKVERIWFVGGCVYIGAAVLLAMAQVLLPAVGALIVLACSIGTADIDDTDGLRLFAGFGIQAALGVYVLAGPWGPSIIDTTLKLMALFGPFIVGAVLTRRVLRRAHAAAIT